MRYYHSTPLRNKEAILMEGIKPDFMGFVYLTTSYEDAVKFQMLRFEHRVVVFEVELPEESVEESFDHNEKFFKCRCFVHNGRIPSSAIVDGREYNLSGPLAQLVRASGS